MLSLSSASFRVQAQCKHEERQAQGQQIDGQLHQPVAALPPYAVLQVVEHVHREEVEARAAARQEPEQGRPPRRHEAERGGEQTQGEPSVGQGEGVFELRVGGAVSDATRERWASQATQ